MRALEWRARRFSDPAERLQFLRRKAAEAGRRPNHVRHEYARDRCVRYLRRLSLTSVLFLVAMTNTNTKAVLPNITPRKPALKSQVWLVQTTPQFDLYSNGLRIEEQYATSTAPRRYVAFASNFAGPIDQAAEWRTEPAGIVYHTTESHLAPFMENRESVRCGAPVRDCSNM